MKKLIFSIALAALSLGVITAQEEVFTAKLKKEEVPQAITIAIEKDFPGLIASGFKTIPAEFVDGTFLLASSNNKPDRYDTYQVEMKGPRYNAEATYDSMGKLISARESYKNTPLPVPVERAVKRDNPGWTASQDHELLTINRDDQQKAYYRVGLTKGNEKMWVTYDAHGNETKTGKEHRMHHM
ncbi:MAG: hypothetical protein H6577_27570 [Lewinellaceae bacterium]|nr:hypothetical protein [Saprospiraceae bacterium]MCB0522766.1 hypothetical protein [Saprospiraceae bacterium]MCB9341905.1 hypothetical protein [Lewinellaceae bacterium]